MLQNFLFNFLLPIIGNIFVVVIVIGGYLLPSIIGFRLRLKNCFAIFLFNLCFGWTVIVWIGCLAWATSGTADRWGVKS